MRHPDRSRGLRTSNEVSSSQDFLKPLVQLPHDKRKVVTFETFLKGVSKQYLSIKYLFFLIIQSKFYEKLQNNRFLQANDT